MFGKTSDMMDGPSFIISITGLSRPSISRDDDNLYLNCKLEADNCFGILLLYVPTYILNSGR
jgi:hypothetical protein